MLKLLLVLLGGAIGTGFRYGLSILIYSYLERPKFAWANFFINLSGSFLIGFLAESFDKRPVVSPAVQVALLAGLLGGYTTFSSFSLETLGYLREGLWGRALLYSMGSVVLGLAAVWLGVRLAQSVA